MEKEGSGQRRMRTLSRVGGTLERAFFRTYVAFDGFLVIAGHVVPFVGIRLLIGVNGA